MTQPTHSPNRPEPLLPIRGFARKLVNRRLIAAFLSTVCAASLHAGPAASGSATTATSSTRYGLFGGLDHRSAYGQGVFPEPFLVDDSDLEEGEARFDWLHSQSRTGGSNEFTVEVEQGFGLLTLELELHFLREREEGVVTQGIGNIDLGARYPLFQYVSAGGLIDNTTGVGIELGVQTNSRVSKNTELVPKIFNDLKIGEHFTMQTLVGYSTLFGRPEEGGGQSLEYGFTFGWTIQHKDLPLPGVLQLIPIFELSGEQKLNQEDAGHNVLQGNIGFRANLKSIGPVQPRLGFGYVFPIDRGAREELQRGFFTSLVFEY